MNTFVRSVLFHAVICYAVLCRLRITWDAGAQVYNVGAWVAEPMALPGAAAVPRVMGDATLLPNGVIAMNGGGQVSSDTTRFAFAVRRD